MKTIGDLFEGAIGMPAADLVAYILRTDAFETEIQEVLGEKAILPFSSFSKLLEELCVDNEGVFARERKHVAYLRNRTGEVRSAILVATKNISWELTISSFFGTLVKGSVVFANVK